MASLEGKVSYAGLGKEISKYPYVEDFVDTSWTLQEAYDPRGLNSKVSFSCPPNAENLMDGGYDSGEDYQPTPLPKNGQPEVNLKNVMSGIFAILMGHNKDHSGLGNLPRLPSTDVKFLAPSTNGESTLQASVYAPSAPSYFEHACKEVLGAEPPEWLPDSKATECMQCNARFTALTRGRHHCRFCGGIFCRQCSKGKSLLPYKFRERNPQRVCDTCYDILDPLQNQFINTISNAAQVAKHDVMDWTSARGWLNLPVGLSMEHEIYKSVNTLRTFCQVSRLNPEKSIPAAVLKGAQGLAILTVAKAGALLMYKVGTGLVVARKQDGSWSAPSAILSIGMGWGVQVGCELMDFILVLHDTKAVKTFCSRMHFSLGAGCSVAAGPIGRVLEADLRAGDKGSGMCYTYSCSKGAFVGVSLEGNVVSTRMDTNSRFYGDPYLTTDEILLGNEIMRPKAAQPLYSALKDLYFEMID